MAEQICRATLAHHGEASGESRAALGAPLVSSVILWQGASCIDGEPIVLLASHETRPGKANRKTGAVVQTYILRADVHPIEAARMGQDRAICGDCPLAGPRDGTLRGRVCYVNLGFGPNAIWRAYQAGKLPTVDPALYGVGKIVRLGAYGDPAAVPFHVWDSLLSDAAGWMGYTHQWQREGFDTRILRYCMASTQGADLERVPAGARAFHVVPRGTRLPEGTVRCPASEEAPTHGRVQCASCRLCGGMSQGRGRHVAIEAHGSGGLSLVS